MSHPEMFLCEIQALQQLRQHRADRAARQLQRAYMAQRVLSGRIQQARERVEQVRGLKPGNAMSCSIVTVDRFFRPRL